MRIFHRRRHKSNFIPPTQVTYADSLQPRPAPIAVRAYQAPLPPVPIAYVNTATLIPTGMHTAEDTYRNEGWRTADLIPTGMHGLPGRGVDVVRSVQDSVVRSLVAKGIRPDRARALVHRAHRRLVKHGRRGGLGDDNSDALAAISADAKSVQASHQNMINNMASWEEKTPGWVTSDDDLRRTFIDQLNGLKSQFVDRSLPILGVQFPYQIDRTNPAGAIVLAVRDDIQATIDLLDARKSQQLLARQISDLSKGPLSSGIPSFNFPKLDIPWYVWGAGIGVGALALKQMLK